jgi:hypothetical protein
MIKDLTFYIYGIVDKPIPQKKQAARAKKAQNTARSATFTYIHPKVLVKK